MDKENFEKIKKIKKIKTKKRITVISIVVVFIIIAFVAIYFADKNAKIFNNNFASSIDKIFVQNNVANGNNQEDKAKKSAAKVAIKKFKELGENTKQEDLEILKIQRKGEEYYYISAKINTLEVRIKDNKITRINSIPVQ